jgi:hypothetical protein
LQAHNQNHFRQQILSPLVAISTFHDILHFNWAG